MNRKCGAAACAWARRSSSAPSALTPPSEILAPSRSQGSGGACLPRRRRRCKAAVLKAMAARALEFEAETALVGCEALLPTSPEYTAGPFPLAFY